MEAMHSPKNSSRVRRRRQLTGLSVLAIAGVVVSIYATSRWRRGHKAQELLESLPAPVPQAEKQAVAASGDEPAGIERTVIDETGGLDVPQSSPQKRPLAHLTVNQLYRLAQHHNILGRSNMRKTQLIEALQSKGITEAAV